MLSQSKTLTQMPSSTVQERIENIYDILSEGQQAMMLQHVRGVDGSKPWNNEM